MRLLAACAALSLLCLTAAQAAPKNKITDEQELIPLQASYLRGWRDNYDNVFAPRFTAEERARLTRVEFKMERRLLGFEPFAFLYRRDLNQVLVSAASLLFLDDVMYAFAWLNVKGYDIQSVGDYLMMLRTGTRGAAGRQSRSTRSASNAIPRTRRSPISQRADST